MCKKIKYNSLFYQENIFYTYLLGDSVGNIIKVDDDGCKSLMNYDEDKNIPNAYGLITSIKTTVNNKELQTLFEYDESHLLSKITYPDSKSVTFGYSKIGLLKSIGNEDNTSSYAKNGTYGPTGHFKSLTAGNGKIFVNDWNPESDILDGFEWGIDGKPDNELTWNNRGNLIKRTLNGIECNYEYDKLNQLTKEKREGQQMYVWTYDSKGNRLTEKKAGGAIKGIVCYPKCDLIKSDGKWNYNYDANGNLIAKGTTANATGTDSEGSSNFEGWKFDATSGEVWHYEYDLLNRLIKVSHSKSGTNSLAIVAEYKYDYRGLIVCRITGSGASKVTEYFAYDTDGKLIYTEKGTEKHDYVYANGKLWCEIVTKGNTTKTYYHHTDHLGTTICITDSTGKVIWECEHEAFGKCITKSSNTFTPNFTGKFLDEITNLYYFNARWYDAETGRFITEDPVRDGMNWFVYCRNNPLKYIDPMGLSTTLDDFAYQQRTENSPYKKEGPQDQEKYNKSFNMEVEYALRNQGYSPTGIWNNIISPSIDYNVFALFNFDFGRDFMYDANQSWKNKQYLKWLLQGFDAFGEILFDCGVAVVGAGILDILLLAAKYSAVDELSMLSIHNKKSDYMLMGPFKNSNVDSYVKMAKENGDLYFNFGRYWNIIQKIFGFSNDEMFTVFNKSAIDYAMQNGKELRFTMDVRTLNPDTFSYKEWNYIKNLYGFTDLNIMEDGFWYGTNNAR